MLSNSIIPSKNFASNEMASATVLFAVFFTLSYNVDQTYAKVNRKGDIVFGNYQKMEDGKIFEKNGTSLSNYTSEDEGECLLECVKQEHCRSVNLHFERPNQIQCELLNWGGTAFHRYLKPRPNSYSMRLLAGACWPNPCKNGGECVTNIGGQPYMCSCSKNFTGNNCEKAGCVLFDFENGIADWTRTGTAFDNQPTYGDNSKVRRGSSMTANLRGDWWIGSNENRSSPSHPAGLSQGDEPMGTMTSPPFFIRGKSIKFLIGGGSDINVERIELLISGNVVAKASSATDAETMNPKYFDVTNYHDNVAQIRIVDQATGSWHHINVDHIEDSICSE